MTARREGGAANRDEAEPPMGSPPDGRAIAGAYGAGCRTHRPTRPERLLRDPHLETTMHRSVLALRSVAAVAAIVALLIVEAAPRIRF